MGKDIGDVGLLILIIDTNPFIWSKYSNTDKSFTKVMEHLIVFINAYLACKHDNKLAVIASHYNESKFIYPTNDAIDVGPRPANAYQQFWQVDNSLVNSLKQLALNDTIDDKEYGYSMISSSLSLALCYINKIIRLNELDNIKPRILVLSVSPDSSVQYIPIMNCIFSAQKANIPIDVCKLFDEETIFLQQATHITNGVFQNVEDSSMLLQYLLFSFLPNRSLKSIMVLPDQEQVDLRASCFCHKKIIDIGYVCSVCLSVFCSYSTSCSTCLTNYSLVNMNGRNPNDTKTITHSNLK